MNLSELLKKSIQWLSLVGKGMMMGVGYRKSLECWLCFILISVVIWAFF